MDVRRFLMPAGERTTAHTPQRGVHFVVRVAACALLLSTWASGPAVSAGLHSAALAERTNAVRLAHGARPLRVDATLSAAAQRRAEEIVSSGKFAHERPDGTLFARAADETGYAYAVLGENLAIDFLHEDPLLDAWLASPDHRRNLLSDAYADIGIGIASGDVDGIPTMVAVELFGSLRDPLLRGWERTPAALPLG